MVPKRCRSRIGIYSKTCSYARGANICNFAFACVLLSLTAFCMQKMLKIPQTVEEVSFLKLTVSTFFFVVSYFGLI